MAAAHTSDRETVRLMTYLPLQQLVLQVSIIFRVVNDLIHAFREVLYNTNPAANHVHDDSKLIAINFFNRVNREKKLIVLIALIHAINLQP